MKRLKAVKKAGWPAILGLLSLFGAAEQAVAGNMEAKVYAVTTWNGGCSGSTRTWWDNMADAWYNEITDSGFSFLGFCLSGHCNDAYRKDGRLVDGNLINSLFADSSVVRWGQDHNHVDEADAALVALHGGESGDVYFGAVRVNEPGDGDCSMRRDEMKLGNNDLEFLHLSSCQSMDDNQWKSWWQAFNGLHQVDGFHGLMWIGSGLVNDYEDFADDSFDVSISEAWLDNMYVANISGNDDQCPVAYGVGSTTSDLWNRIGNERYDLIYSDPAKIGYWGTTYIGGCDPAAETVIGSDKTN